MPTKTKTPRKLKQVVKLTIRRPGEMTAESRTNVADWLQRQVTLFREHGHAYNDKYRARLYSTNPTDLGELT